ncbi:polyamine ABC transporter substrate-binding protein [Vibrio aestuarianus]|uniref:Putrescine-binding periplasmic protein n=1 Tax=Vibrio aestuarianus TaxID=28171 RepID=A0ABM9FIU8_9VIBR|nr:spermidine/putrescine ABC transporter substrate-binding protein [Vibrio aestuarianus]MDE1229760.1 spermidine/putrescine ABC transporter substrate-binding protein [Vibrio aestuarianus]MDE1258371.1 spermidine/putrescine ABC transporter substrate-binding protein [Vibrio aestuarianus]MDE1270636.1 spermidine/putrescine ABC transporter substrate-binding protein [Vibrio aestuarianus]MDE1292201.1 spermidine/putrescine ABC transporter substrate-binding protein [Vibrio aestuarianus]MDE1307265.1 sperm
MKTFIKGLVLSAMLTASQVSANTQTLNVYAWGGYLPEKALQQFEEQENVTINYSTFENNESMYTKLKLLKGGGYDVVFASAYFIEKMGREGLLAELDHTQIPNMKDAMPSLLGQAHAPKNRYSLPYIWGITGISYNETLIPEGVTRWADLWNKQYNQQVMLIDDIRDVFGMALILNGFSINTKNEQEIEKAYQSLEALKDNVLLYNSDAPHVPYVSGEAALGMQWNGNAYQGQVEMPELKFVMPEEGAVLWMDNFTIPSGSKNKALAHKFINFMYQAENQAEIVNSLGYASATLSGRALLPVELRDNPTIFPSESDMAKGEFINDVGSEALAIYEKYWQRLRNQ